jgi:tetratricopeptide (TPR) repeat protein
MDGKHKKIFNPWFLCFCFSLLSVMLPGNGFCAEDAYKGYYLDGTDYMEKEAYEDAIEAFSAAIDQNDKEKAKIRFYGMKFGEYMPHREKGICLFQLKQYQEAIKELEISLQQLPTDEARKYLDLANSAYDKQVQECAIEVDTPVELERIREAREANWYGVGVIIGNRDYENEDITDVCCAIRDAKMVQKYLIETFGYRKGNIIFEPNATKGILENIFGTDTNQKGLLYQIVNNNPGKADLFVYYSGHGVYHVPKEDEPDDHKTKAFILPVDGNPNTPEISGYSLKLLYDNLSKLPTRSTTIVTDACYSDAGLFKNASPVAIIMENTLDTFKDDSTKNFNIMGSSTGSEKSNWYPQKGHGLFTYYFLLGLTGEADNSDDNRISFKELKAFLQDNVPYKARELYPGRIQTPTFHIPNNDSILVQYN